MQQPIASPMVAPANTPVGDTTIFIGIDLGGTQIKVVVLDAAGRQLAEQVEPTNDGDGMVWKHKVMDIVQHYRTAFALQDVYVGISAPGLPNAINSFIACMPGRMAGLERLNWEEVLGVPAFVLNDAVAAMMGEATLGAASNLKDVVMLTLGTGVGGAIMINGKPYQGFMNKAGHIGHMVVNDEGDCDVTGMPGSLEECIGNCTIEKRTGNKFQSTELLLQACKNGDAFAQQVWQKSVRQLGIALASVANLLSPEVIVIGGGIAMADDDLFVPLGEYMKQYEWQPAGHTTPIVKAHFGKMAGAIGAACFAMQQFSNTNATQR